MRKPIGITGEPNRPLVVCDDGSVWRFVDSWGTDRLHGEWLELPPIPESDSEPAFQAKEAARAAVAKEAKRTGFWPDGTPHPYPERTP